MSRAKFPIAISSSAFYPFLSLSLSLSLSFVAKNTIKKKKKKEKEECSTIIPRASLRAIAVRICVPNVFD